jgi:hypothetical protein
MTSDVEKKGTDSFYLKNTGGGLTMIKDAYVDGYGKGYDEKSEEHRYQIVACSVAANQNTRESIKNRIDRSNPFWTLAYSDVCDAVDREILLREERDELRASLKAFEEEHNKACLELVQLREKLKVAVEALECLSKNRARTIFIESPEHVEHFFKPLDEALAKLGAQSGGGM